MESIYYGLKSLKKKPQNVTLGLEYKNSVFHIHYY